MTPHLRISYSIGKTRVATQRRHIDKDHNRRNICKPCQDSPCVRAWSGDVPDNLPDRHAIQCAAETDESQERSLCDAMEGYVLFPQSPRDDQPSSHRLVAHVRLRSYLAVCGCIANSGSGSLRPSDGTGELRFPRFKHVMQFSYHSTGGATTQVYEFLVQNKASVRYLSLHNPNWSFPTDAISVRNLTNLDFQGIFSSDSRAFAEILSNGHQLESLRLECILECMASAQFREFSSALPFLHHFAFSLMGYRVNDHDLFPAIADFLRDRTALRSLQLTVPSAEWASKRLGYDATVWGVLPSLTSLRSLTATLPKDVAPPVAMWLVPRGVQALSLQALTPVNTLEFVSVRIPRHIISDVCHGCVDYSFMASLPL